MRNIRMKRSRRPLTAATVLIATTAAWRVNVRNSHGVEALLGRHHHPDHRQGVRGQRGASPMVIPLVTGEISSFVRTSVALASTPEDDSDTSGDSVESNATTESASVSTRRRSTDRPRGPRQKREASSSGSSGPISSGPRSTGPRSAGPRSSGPRSSGPRSSGPRSSGPRSATSRSSGPRSPRPERSTRRNRTPANPGTPPEPGLKKVESSSQEATKEPFDNQVFTARQTPNPGAPRLDLRAALSQPPAPPLNFRCVTPGLTCFAEHEAKDLQRPEAPFAYKSLDDLLSIARARQGLSIDPNDDENVFSLSKKFNADRAFRNDLRSAIRLDVFETTPFYANLPEKAKSVLLLPDSSLEGSWRIPDKPPAEPEKEEESTNEEDTDGTPSVRRMKHTTRVLNQALEEYYNDNGDETVRFRFTGDDLFEAIGSICGNGASTHWIDIYGVQDRQINHSWHLDAGRSPQNCRTVLWGFPPEDHYAGTGVFSHIVSLEDPFGSTLDIVDDEDTERERPRMEPVLFEGGPGEEYVFRPLYEAGKELLVYRDVDVLHSAPDVAYRTSVMRFM